MDGERDPRNLLLAFQIAKNIIHRGYDLGEVTYSIFLTVASSSFSLILTFFCYCPFCPVYNLGWHTLSRSVSCLPPVNFLFPVSGKFTEELFEVTSCYFPIDFTPVSPCLLSCSGVGTAESRECSRQKCRHRLPVTLWKTVIKSRLLTHVFSSVHHRWSQLWDHLLILWTEPAHWHNASGVVWGFCMTHLFQFY